jgi:hypothetical protein
MKFKIKMKKLPILLLIFLLCVNSIFSQEAEKSYLGVDAKYNFLPVIFGVGSEEFLFYNIGLVFEKQFSPRWGYTAGLSFLHIKYWYRGDPPDIKVKGFYFDIPIGVKHYSKNINLSAGISVNLLIRETRANHVPSLPVYAFGPYLAIDKDFTIFQNIKIEPYICGSLTLGPDRWGDIAGLPFLGVGLRLKYEI